MNNNNALWALMKSKERLFPHIPVAYKNIILTLLFIGCIGVVLMLWGGSIDRKPATPSPEVPAKAGVLLEKE